MRKVFEPLKNFGLTIIKRIKEGRKSFPVKSKDVSEKNIKENTSNKKGFLSKFRNFVGKSIKNSLSSRKTMFSKLKKFIPQRISSKIGNVVKENPLKIKNFYSKYKNVVSKNIKKISSKIRNLFSQRINYILENIKEIPLKIKNLAVQIIKTSSLQLKIISPKLRKFLPKWLQKKEENEDEDFIIEDNFDPTKTREEKIEIEKRKRNQVYQTLDYLLQMNTYYDFFSDDAFRIARYAKYLTQISNKKIVTTDFLLLAFFYTDSRICEILKKYEIEKNSVKDLMNEFYFKNSIAEEEKEEKFSIYKTILQKWNSFIKKDFEEEEKVPLFLNLKYSMEVNRIFKIAAKNARDRFKTPVISTEILFITLMEEKETKGSKIINMFLETKSQWLLLRYELIKKIFFQESAIRNKIPQNQRYFAYLLKIKLKDNEFERLIEDDYFEFGVSLFRNRLIKYALKTNIFDLIEQDVRISMDANPSPRKYTT